MNYNTLDEVANITGINARTLKYYVERKIIISSLKKENPLAVSLFESIIFSTGHKFARKCAYT
ncbi:MAG: MerR family transcriptional regulator [Butyrivibrio sp.]|nr:MerR family transcriptional regulator [Butyrivibrio sp.]